MITVLGVMTLLVLFAAIGYGNSGSTRATGRAGLREQDKDSISTNPSTDAKRKYARQSDFVCSGTNSTKTHACKDDEDSSGEHRSHNHGHKDEHGKSYDKGERDDDDGPANQTYEIVFSVNPAEVKAGDQIQISGSGFGSSPLCARAVSASATHWQHRSAGIPCQGAGDNNTG